MAFLLPPFPNMLNAQVTYTSGENETFENIGAVQQAGVFVIVFDDTGVPLSFLRSEGIARVDILKGEADPAAQLLVPAHLAR